MIKEAPRRPAAPHWLALDGLRGLAVLAVLAYHAFPDAAPNGFSGVDVFFVLSGFLITTLLVRERRMTGRVSLPSFYMRRALRLYPALVLTVLIVLAIAVGQGDAKSALPGAAAALLYVAHITTGLGIDSGLLSHTWTLSLEENFYVFWPAVLLAWMSGGRRRGAAAAALMLLGVLLVPGLLPGSVSEMYWRGLPMLVGSLLALVLPSVAPRTQRAAVVGATSLVLLVAILLVPMQLPKAVMQGPIGLPSLLTVLAISGFVLAHHGLVARALSVTPLVWVGRRAYGLYLYHFPIILGPLTPKLLSVLGVDAPWLVDMLVGIGLTFVVAGASYRWVEKPFLNLKDRFRG